MNFIKYFVKFIWTCQLQSLFDGIMISTGSKLWKVLDFPTSLEYFGTFRINMSYQSFSQKLTKTKIFFFQIRPMQFRICLIIYEFLQFFVKHHGKINAFINQFRPGIRKLFFHAVCPPTSRCLAWVKHLGRGYQRASWASFLWPSA